ncbi:GNAT family N-acetyltransferase [Neomegalonema perideroedes]|uniref:GNAT family N-acetyltransferase n=1 Tax=Neomegalonema perideroedes TaxID=217219 RepID=UPI00035F028E|nr:GNAT family protein [Neomegalonema perideroedes]
MRTPLDLLRRIREAVEPPEPPARDGERLESARLILRTPRAADGESWIAVRRASADFLQPWEPLWPSDHLSRASWRRRLAWMRAETEADRARFWLLFLRERREEVVGGLSMTQIRRGASSSAQIGYWMGRSYAGRGLMTEAVDAARGHAFRKLGLRRLEAACLPANLPSQRLLRRLGFQQEGLARGYLEVNGRPEDHLLFSLLAEDAPDTR